MGYDEDHEDDGYFEFKEQVENSLAGGTGECKFCLRDAVVYMEDDDSYCICQCCDTIYKVEDYFESLNWEYDISDFDRSNTNYYGDNGEYEDAWDEEGNSVYCEKCGAPMKFNTEKNEYECSICEENYGRQYWFDICGFDEFKECANCTMNYPSCLADVDEWEEPNCPYGHRKELNW